MKIYNIDTKEFEDEIELLRSKGYTIYDMTYCLGGRVLPSTSSHFLKEGVYIDQSPEEEHFKMAFIKPVK